MIIKIIDITPSQTGTTSVTFSSALGVASAQWAGGGQTPEVGKDYGVELDVNTTLDKTTNASNVEVDDPCLVAEGDNIVIRGTVEAVEDDGLAYLRLAKDCLVMIDTAGDVSSGELIQLRISPDLLSVTLVGII